MELREPLIPPGMGELGEAHRTFARCFEIRDGLLAAAALESTPRIEAGNDQLEQAVEALNESERKELLLRMSRGEYVEVSRELKGMASALLEEIATSASGRTLGELAKVAEEWDVKLERRAHEDRLDELEARQEKLWVEIVELTSREHPRFAKPVELLEQLHLLALERGGLDAFQRRLTALGRYDTSPAFMQRLIRAGIVDG